jgi:uncharacterized protein HemX
VETGLIEIIKQNSIYLLSSVLAALGLFATSAGGIYILYERQRNKNNKKQFESGERRFNHIESEGQRRFKQNEKTLEEIKKEIKEERKENKDERRELQDAIGEVERDVMKIDKNVAAIVLHHEITGKKIKGVDFD